MIQAKNPAKSEFDANKIMGKLSINAKWRSFLVTIVHILLAIISIILLKFIASREKWVRTSASCVR